MGVGHSVEARVGSWVVEGTGCPLYRLPFLEGVLRLEPFPRVSL